MRRLFFRPPSEVPSLGLLQLRLTLSAYLIGIAFAASRQVTLESAAWNWWVMGLPSLLAAVLTLLGALTPLVQMIVVLTQAGQLVELLPESLDWANLTLSAWPPMLTISIAVSLSLLGPGRYSIDSYLFGCREIRIPRLPSRPVE
jgi:uncharacterized membrane protein YphA (DoxX/SURF4 family)